LPQSQSPRERLASICGLLPEAVVEDVEGQEHLIFRVRGRTFAYYLEDHHGDGEVAIVCKAEPELNTALIEQDPTRFFMPAYVGPRGWVGYRLNLADVDWDEVADLAMESYCLIAPKSLTARLTTK
jgi:hypothetical protein